MCLSILVPCEFQKVIGEQAAELNKTLKTTATVRLVWCSEKDTARPTSLALQCSTQSAEWK